MVRFLLVALIAAMLAGCAGEPYRPGPNNSLATSSCTNGDPALRQARLGCPN